MREGKRVYVTVLTRKIKSKKTKEVRTVNYYARGTIAVKDGVEYVDFDGLKLLDDNGVATADFTPLSKFPAYKIVE